MTDSINSAQGVVENTEDKKWWVNEDGDLMFISHLHLSSLLNRRPTVADLSPAARAIVAAFRERHEECWRPGPSPDYWQEACLAAALTALTVRIKGAPDIRQDVLDIMNELEGGND